MLPGVRAWYDAARELGLRRGVASSSTRAWVLGNLRRLDLADWDCLCCREDVAHAKPAPDLYLAALARLGVGEPSRAIALEDSEHGVAAAKAAGLFCVAVPCSLTASHDFSQADRVLGSLDQLSLAELTFELDPQTA